MDKVLSSGSLPDIPMTKEELIMIKDDNHPN